MIESYPLHWPVNKPRTSADKRKRAAFGTQKKDAQYNWFNKKQLSVAEAIKRLLKELDAFTKPGQTFRIPPDSIVISSNIKVKLDGLPYSNQKEPDDRGVAVYFKLDGRDYCLPCDKWDRVADNIAAIAAHLNAMRGIERWGVGENHDVFTGFKALPEQSSFLGRSVWEILGLEKMPASSLDVKKAYQEKAKELHPDAPTGSADLFHELTVAYKQALSQYE
jgi:hypothetical protein